MAISARWMAPSDSFPRHPSLSAIPSISNLRDSSNWLTTVQEATTHGPLCPRVPGPDHAVWLAEPPLPVSTGTAGRNRHFRNIIDSQQQIAIEALCILDPVSGRLNLPTVHSAHHAWSSPPNYLFHPSFKSSYSYCSESERTSRGVLLTPLTPSRHKTSSQIAAWLHVLRRTTHMHEDSQSGTRLVILPHKEQKWCVAHGTPHFKTSSGLWLRRLSPEMLDWGSAARRGLAVVLNFQLPTPRVSVFICFIPASLASLLNIILTVFWMRFKGALKSLTSSSDLFPPTFHLPSPTTIAIGQYIARQH